MSTHLGVRGWTQMENIHFSPDTCTYLGAPADFVVHVSLAYLGDMQLELIQPVSGDSLYQEFVQSNGPGIHHVAFEPDDFESAIAQAESNGLQIVQAGAMADGMMEFAYVDGAAAGVPFIELIKVSDDMAAFFEAIKTPSETRQ